ncbi:MAG TPA: mannosyltransferase family protein [Pyrinomonadaceae bacterium]|nr:mannosyltransferase family protein [Pyrinomonadaceae bacterium]
MPLTNHNGGNSIANRLFKDPSIRSALFSFTLTRLLILFVVLLSANMRFQPAVQDQFGDIHESSISLKNTRVTDVLTRLTSSADSLWILNIARNGYEKESFSTIQQRTWAYFPLYPVLLRALSSLTGNLPITGIVFSSLLFLFALIVLYRLVIAFDYEPSDAERAVFYVAAFPVSYFFSLAQTESLFLLLTLGCIYAARRQRWWLAGICGALASATRFAGVFLILPLALMYWPRGNKTSRIKADVLSLLLVPFGLLAFMLYLKSITGNAFAFADIQLAWGHDAGFFWRPLMTFIRELDLVSLNWDFRLLNFAAAVMALVCGVVWLRRRAWAFALYTLVSVLVPLSYQAGSQSLARYVMVIFPVIILLGIWGRSPRLDQTIRVIFIALLSLMSAMLAVRVTLAFS